jgi:hypothetical protein
MMNKNDSQAPRRSARTMRWWFVIAGLGLLAANAPAATWYVATNGVDTHNGTGGWDQAFATISNAVTNAASSGDTVLVSNGIYTLTAQIIINKSLLVRSWNNGNYDRTNTIINGNWPTTTNRCFRLWADGATIAGFTITNGCSGAASGGGITIYKGIVSNCVVAGNQSFTSSGTRGGGGGIYVEDNAVSSAGIYDCDIYGNFASHYGGGIFVRNGTGTIVNCTIRNNIAATNGGGVHLYDYIASAVLSNCFILSNSATRLGGGARLSQCRLYNCVIQYNNTTDGSGGGFQGGTGRVLLYSCLIANNAGPTNKGQGGGIQYYGRGTTDSLEFYNCTITSNSGYQGGGLYVNGMTNMLFVNTIFWGNTHFDANTTSNLYVTAVSPPSTGAFYNCLLGPTNFSGSSVCFVTNCTDQDPRMIDLPGGNYRLQKGSPVINAGLNQEWMTNAVDLDGHPRLYPIFGTNVDIGAYEYYVPQGAVISIF